MVYFGVRDYVSDAERRGAKPQLKLLAGGSRTLQSLRIVGRNPGKHANFNEVLAEIRL